MSCNSCSNSSSSCNTTCNNNCNSNTNTNSVCKDFRYNKTILALEKRKNDLLNKIGGTKSHDDYSYYVKEREFRKDIKILRHRLEYLDRGLKFLNNTRNYLQILININIEVQNIYKQLFNLSNSDINSEKFQYYLKNANSLKEEFRTMLDTFTYNNKFVFYTEYNLSESKPIAVSWNIDTVANLSITWERPGIYVPSDIPGTNLNNISSSINASNDAYFYRFNSSTYLHPDVDANASSYFNFNTNASTRTIEFEINLAVLVNDLNKLDTHLNNTYTTQEKIEISKKRLNRNLKIKEKRLNEIKSSKHKEIEYQIQEIEREIKDYKIELMNTGCSC